MPEAYKKQACGGEQDEQETNGHLTVVTHAVVGFNMVHS